MSLSVADGGGPMNAMTTSTSAPLSVLSSSTRPARTFFGAAGDFGFQAFLSTSLTPTPTAFANIAEAPSKAAAMRASASAPLPKLSSTYARTRIVGSATAAAEASEATMAMACAGGTRMDSDYVTRAAPATRGRARGAIDLAVR